MADLDLRLVRYFIAVAEHASFTDAAAAALHISHVRCQYSVTATDLRRIEPADVVMPHPGPLSPKARGITEGNTRGLSRVHEGSTRGPRPLRVLRRRSYGPCPPQAGAVRRSPRSR
jgi:hypothetical protein